MQGIPKHFDLYYFKLAGVLNGGFAGLVLTLIGGDGEMLFSRIACKSIN
jgi:hypothetical protein